MEGKGDSIFVATGAGWLLHIGLRIDREAINALWRNKKEQDVVVIVIDFVAESEVRLTAIVCLGAPVYAELDLELLLV